VIQMIINYNPGTLVTVKFFISKWTRKWKWKKNWNQI